MTTLLKPLQHCSLRNHREGHDDGNYRAIRLSTRWCLVVRDAKRLIYHTACTGGSVKSIHIKTDSQNKTDPTSKTNIQVLMLGGPYDFHINSDNGQNNDASFFRKPTSHVKISIGVTSNTLLALASFLGTVLARISWTDQQAFPTTGLSGVDKVDQIAARLSRNPQGCEHRGYIAILHLHCRPMRRHLVWECREYCSWRIDRNKIHWTMHTRHIPYRRQSIPL